MNIFDDILSLLRKWKLFRNYAIEAIEHCSCHIWMNKYVSLKSLKLKNAAIKQAWVKCVQIDVADTQHHMKTENFWRSVCVFLSPVSASILPSISFQVLPKKNPPSDPHQQKKLDW